MSNEEPNKFTAPFISQPLSFYLGITGITSILFLDTYLSFQDSSIRSMNMPSIGQVFTFLFFYFLCLHVAAKPLRYLVYGFFLSLFEAIKLVFKKDLTFLIFANTIKKESDQISRTKLHAQALEENNTLKFELLKDAKKKEKLDNNIKNIIFPLSILIPVNIYQQASFWASYMDYNFENWFYIATFCFTLLWFSIYQKDYFYIRLPQSFSFTPKKDSFRVHES